ncbi:MAG: amidohydrolase family protein [Acidobacteriia bacterium]|nr:amidohydrolase family protein [Terriglobia bacterium]
MRKLVCGVISILLSASLIDAQPASALSPAVQAFVSVDAPVFALTHVRVIDGTGAAAVEDQTLVVESGRIKAIGRSTEIKVPETARVLDLKGSTVIPGIVGMHDHIFYPSGGGSAHYNDLAFSAPRLYLAGGVTTIRTTGSLEPYTDLNLKKSIDTGRVPGPKMHVTGPYLEGPGAFTLQMHELTGPEDARRMVEFWADQGVTSFKAYMNITRAELSTAIDAAHKRGFKVTGHLCSIGFRDAAALGIDDLEHGLLVDTEFVTGKKPDVCPPQQEARESIAKLDLESAPVKEMIRDLVEHHVAITSTLPVFEISLPNRPPLDQRVLDAMLPESRIDYLSIRARIGQSPFPGREVAFKKAMQFEHAFVMAGGLLIAGLDPTGYGGVVPGFGDQREIELLVEAGFTPLEAIKIATSNGAQFLGELNHIGTLAAGKQADLVVIQGDPSKNISDIKKVTLVFKDGVGYDSGKLIESVRGMVGLR